MKGVIRTARVSYSGEDRVDITRKGNVYPGNCLAPSWDIVMAVKSAKISWKEYESLYLTEMRKSYSEKKSAWRDLVDIANDTGVVLVCYCSNPSICHRSLASDLLKKAAHSFGISLCEDGEVQSDS